MQTRLDRDFKWSRLAFVLLATGMLADTAPHPQLGPGLLETLAVRVQSSLHDGQ